MKPVDVKDNTYIDFIKVANDKDPKFKVGNHVRISKLFLRISKEFPNIFPKGYTLNWFEKVLVIKEVKNTVRWTYFINDLNGQYFL